MDALDRLLQRHTVKKFHPEPLGNEVVDNALKVAHRTPTSLNSRPVKIYDISVHVRDEWLAHQVPAQTAPHLFLLTYSTEVAISHIRTGFAKKFNCAPSDEKIEGLLDQYVRPGSEHYPELQLYLTAGYFSAALEMQGGGGCWIRGFDDDMCRTAVGIPADEKPGLLFAAGTPADDWIPSETEWIRPFSEFFEKK